MLVAVGAGISVGAGGRTCAATVIVGATVGVGVGDGNAVGWIRAVGAVVGVGTGVLVGTTVEADEGGRETIIGSGDLSPPSCAASRVISTQTRPITPARITATSATNQGPLIPNTVMFFWSPCISVESGMIIQSRKYC